MQRKWHVNLVLDRNQVYKSQYWKDLICPLITHTLDHPASLVEPGAKLFWCLAIYITLRMNKCGFWIYFLAETTASLIHSTFTIPAHKHSLSKDLLELQHKISPTMYYFVLVVSYIAMIKSHELQPSCPLNGFVHHLTQRSTLSHTSQWLNLSNRRANIKIMDVTGFRLLLMVQVTPI